jgi:hypothetical protein
MFGRSEKNQRAPASYLSTGAAPVLGNLHRNAFADAASSAGKAAPASSVTGGTSALTVADGRHTGTVQ